MEGEGRSKQCPWSLSQGDYLDSHIILTVGIFERISQNTLGDIYHHDGVDSSSSFFKATNPKSLGLPKVTLIINARMIEFGMDPNIRPSITI